MNYRDKWDIIRKLGAGGQSTVYLVNEKTVSTSYDAVRRAMRDMVKDSTTEHDAPLAYKRFRGCLRDLIGLDDPSQQGALKVLHEPENARDPGLADERIAREIQVMSETRHPNLMRVKEVDPDHKWYVSEYYPRLTLADNKDLFKGDLRGALVALRPLVEAVAVLHKSGYVHRDIKPQNVFVGSNDELILGDFGLVYFADPEHPRVSATYENVGSRDWMPGWAMGMRIDQVKPTFDVFGLGKLLWSMVSGDPILQLWYFDKPKFDLVRRFPKSGHMRLANELFARCIVEEEETCLPDAGALLERIDGILTIIECNADLLDPHVRRRCRVCGLGEYNLIVDGDNVSARNFGISPAGSRAIKIFSCSHCGHVQLFAYEGRVPAAWRANGTPEKGSGWQNVP